MNTTATGTEAAVCADIAKRQQLGIAKYGTTVAENPLELREWLQHAYEETLDQAVYLKRAIEEIESTTWFKFVEHLKRKEAEKWVPIELLEKLAKAATKHEL